MRFVAAGLSALAVIAFAAPAFAWQGYQYPDLGIAKEFPAAPMMSMGMYKTPVAGNVPAHIFTVSQDDVTYTMTVADLMDKADKGASIMGECVSLAEGEGKPVANMEARVEFGANAVYGRIVSADLKDMTRKMTECLFTKGRLYKITAEISPKNPDFPNSSEAIRFINSLAFNFKPGGDN